MLIKNNVLNQIQNSATKMYLFIIQDRWNGARAGLCGQKLHKMNATLEKVGFSSNWCDIGFISFL